MQDRCVLYWIGGNIQYTEYLGVDDKRILDGPKRTAYPHSNMLSDLGEDISNPWLVMVVGVLIQRDCQCRHPP